MSAPLLLENAEANLSLEATCELPLILEALEDTVGFVVSFLEGGDGGTASAATGTVRGAKFSLGLCDKSELGAARVIGWF